MINDIIHEMINHHKNFDENASAMEKKTFYALADLIDILYIINEVENNDVIESLAVALTHIKMDIFNNFDRR